MNHHPELFFKELLFKKYLFICLYMYMLCSTCIHSPSVAANTQIEFFSRTTKFLTFSLHKSYMLQMIKDVTQETKLFK